MTKHFLAIAISLALIGCSQPAGEPDAVGAALLKPFKAELKEALVAGMQEGPAAAIEICSDKAPEIAASLSVDGVVMGRSSHKLRNPENASPAWLAPFVDKWAAEGIRADDVGRPTGSVVKLDGGRHGYAEPIFMQPLCLTCHGADLSPEIAARIETLYSDDDATGFEVGDLRGVFWVEF